MNVWLLCASSFRGGYRSPWWLTYRQAEELGGHVRKGEKSSLVVFWRWLERKQDEQDGAAEAQETQETPKRFPVLRYYRVFNLEQCEIPAEKLPARVREWGKGRPQVNPIAECEAVVAGMPNPPKIEYGHPGAAYHPAADTVTMPGRQMFDGAAEHYSTLFHELTHSTGHAQRLNRTSIADACRFGSTNYSKEELVAEMGAAFLCATTGIENKTVDNSAAYIAHWLEKLANDPRLVVNAGQAAQHAADYILAAGADDSDPDGAVALASASGAL
jgi:antirestriction protein ArdC